MACIHSWNSLCDKLTCRSPYLVCVALTILLTSSASAQLRSGSTSRKLYHRDVAAVRISEKSEDDESAQLEDDESSVMVANHVNFDESESGVNPARIAVKDSRGVSKVKPAGCTSCGNGGNLRSSGTVIDAPSPMMESSLGSMEEGYSIGSGCGSCNSCEMGCDSGCMSPCDSECVSPLQSLLQRLSIRAEIPLYWRKAQSTPPLVTTAPVGTDSDLAGELGQSTTQLLRSGPYDNEVNAGFRITLSTWLDSCQQRGLMFRYWNAGTLEGNTTFTSDTHPILARPFFNTTATPAQDTQLVAFPGDSTGAITIRTKSEVNGLDIVLRRLAYADRFTRFDWVYGYHQTSIGEALNISSQTTVNANGQSISVADNFETKNKLHGFTAGFMSTRRFACYQLESMFRLTMGNLNQQLSINGESTVVSGGTTNTTNQGLLARSTNSRAISRDTFVLSPEVGINLAYALNSNFDFAIGYNYLMVPKVLQASRQVDPGLRANLSDPLTGPQDPSVPFRLSRYWVGSLGLGMQVRY
jgi:Putative beta barrel porin-7 (BBP7)